MKVFENEHFIALDKPSMWLSTPSRMGEKDPRPCVGSSLQRELGHQIYPIHRLDYEVSGLILFAKTKQGQQVASDAFEAHLIEKTYQAISFAPSESEFKSGYESEWKSRISKGKKRAYSDPNGKECLTLASVVRVDGDHIFWKLRPKTGRPHQLRFELYNHKSPILGDVLYGSQQNWPKGIALRAVSIKIESNIDLAKLGWPITLNVSDLEGFDR
jgi:tRNA pseudouridine32 synthase/23S rRNA pseudouridine746 synthase